MFDKFGEFDSWEEINRAAEGQKAEGDKEALIELAIENGFDEADALDYFEDAVPELCTAQMAADGKLKIEEEELKAGRDEIISDWISYIRTQIFSDDNIALAVRKKGKSLKGCIGQILKWGHSNMREINPDIKKAAGFSGNVKLGMPSALTVHNIIKKYYLEGGNGKA